MGRIGLFLRSIRDRRLAPPPLRHVPAEPTPAVAARIESAQPCVAAPAAIVTRFCTCPDWLATRIRQHFPAEAWVAAAEIAYLESGWNANVVNDTRHLGGGKCNVRYQHPAGFAALTELSVGVFQINVCAHGQTVDYWRNVDNNVRYAAQLYRRRGNWRDWLISARRLGLPT